MSYTHDVGSSRQYFAVDRPNSGPWGTQTPVAGGLFADNVTDLVVAPNSGRATVFWQNGDLTAALKVEKRTLPRGSYRATITPKVGGKTLKKLKVTFKIKR